MSSDASLLLRWREGDKKAGDALVVRHFKNVYRFFASKVGDTADELTQKTFLACVEARDRIDASRPIKAYLFGIARNVLLKHLTKAYRDRGRLEAHEASLHDMQGPRAKGLVTVREEQRLVQNGLARLPLDIQLTLEMHYWWGMSVDEIAEATEVPSGTVKSRLSRGRTMLRSEVVKLDANATQAEAFLAEQRDSGPPVD